MTTMTMPSRTRLRWKSTSRYFCCNRRGYTRGLISQGLLVPALPVHHASRHHDVKGKCLFAQKVSLNREIGLGSQRQVSLGLARLVHVLSAKGYLPMTVSSRSTITTLGTILPRSASEKNVLKQESDWVGADGKVPSGRIPCSRQYSCQQAEPICTPACPTWMDMHSLCSHSNRLHVILGTEYQRCKLSDWQIWMPDWLSKNLMQNRIPLVLPPLLVRKP